jgi:PAS domain S-box-containing protein/diguanylate cyclase (GGDEF)-like protein
MKRIQKILIVDDNPQNLYLLRTLLEGNGYAVDDARHGAEALIKARQSVPDLVISDLLMPVMDGYTLLRQWKMDERLKHIPFIVYTATYTEPKDEKLVLDLGADAFILKPAEPEPFMARILEILEKAACEQLKPAHLPGGGEKELLKEYSEVLIRKLEKKTLQLEHNNRVLQQEIMEHKQVEKTLRESEELFAKAFRSSPMAISISRLADGRLIDVNDAFLKMFGFKREEVIGRTSLELKMWFDPQDRARLADELRTKGGFRDREFRYPMKSGQQGWTQSSAELIELNGEPCVISLFNDITDRRRVEETLRESEERYRNLATHAPIGIYHADNLGRITYSNPRILEITGLTQEEACGDGWASIIYPDDHERVFKNWKEITKRGENYYDEYRILHKDSSVRWVIDTGIPEFDSDGKITGYVGTLQDITGRKEAEKALRESEARLRLSAKAANVGLWDWDLLTNAVHYSPEWKHQIGYSDDEISNSFDEWQSRVHPDDLGPMLQQVQSYIDKPEGVHEAEFRFRHKDGTYRWIYTRADMIRDDTGKPVRMLGCHIDITRMEQLKENLRQAKEVAEKKAAELDQALEVLPIGIFLVDRKGEIYKANKAASDTWEGTMQAGSILDYSAYKGWWPGSGKQLEPHDWPCAQSVEEKAIRDEEIEIETFTGKRKTIRAISAPVVDYKGNHWGAVAINWDITKRKQAESALRESEQRLRSILDTMFVFVGLIDLDGRILEVNNAPIAAAGLKREDVLGRTVPESYWFSYSPVLQEQVRIAISRAAQGEIVREDYSIRIAGGRNIVIDTTFAPLRNASGQITQIVGSAVDITDRKLIEEAQLQTLQRVQSQLQATGQVAEAEALLSGNVEQVARETTELAAKVTGAERINVWLFNEDETELHCIDLYEASKATHSSGMVLKEREYRNEFQALKQAKYVAADDPLTDRRTTGYVETYLKPLRITSMLDTLIHVSGKNFGLLCFEHVDKSHHWEHDEIVFAGQLADKIGLAIFNRQRRMAEEILRESEERYRLVTRATNDIIWDWNLVDDSHWVSDHFQSILGYQEHEIEPGIEAWTTRLHPDDKDRIIQGIYDLIDSGGQYWSGEYRLRRADGSYAYIFDCGYVIRNKEGKPLRMIGSMSDISGRKQAEEKIRRLNRLYKVTSSINTLIVRVGEREELVREACRIAVNEGQFQMAWIGSYTSGRELIPMAWEGKEDGYLQHVRNSLQHDKPGKASPAIQALQLKRPVIINNISGQPEAEWKKQALARGYLSAAALPLIVGGDAVAVIGLYSSEADFFDDEEIKLLTELAGDLSFALHNIAQRERLDYLVSYDPLTGLPNRALFFEHMNSVLDRARTGHKKVGLLVCDLKQFRNINSVYGRQTGDRILQETAARLRELTSDPANIGRVSGDYFTMILHDVRDTTGIAHRFENSLFPSLNKPFPVGDEVIQTSFTGGIAVFPADGEDVETLYRNAEAAMKRAKQSGEKYLFYQAEMTARIAETLQIEGKLRTALHQEQFVLHYQPKINSRTHQITGLEALIRWKDPETGLVPPGKFIPILEETGLILEVGLWAAAKAASDYRKWQKQLKSAPRIAVNVSAVQLRQKDFVEQITKTIRHKGKAIPLEIEITESLIMTDIEQNIDKFKAIQTEDIQIAIDDFGTGYSSLSYISRLPINSLKIDRSFIMNMTTQPESMTIVSTIITLAHSMNFKVVAEGVETEEQAKLLTLLKCDEMQGFLFSKPLPPDDIYELLHSGKTL